MTRSPGAGADERARGWPSGAGLPPLGDGGGLGASAEVERSA